MLLLFLVVVAKMMAACTTPEGEPITLLQLEDGSQVEATLVTAGVPGQDVVTSTDEVGLQFISHSS